MKITNWIPVFALNALLSACQFAEVRSNGPAAINDGSPVSQRAEPDKSLPRISLTPEVLYALLIGEISGHRGQLDVSVAALSRAANSTRDPRIAERATLAALYARRPTDALKNAQLWVELKPESQEAHESLAAAYMENGRLLEAREHFRKILELAGSKGLAPAYLKISATLGRQSNRTETLAIMRSLVALNPERSVAHYALAHLAVRVSDLDTAISAIDRALTLTPGWEDAALFKARVLVSKRDTAKVLEYHEQFLSDYPKANNMRLSYARLLVDQKHWDKARIQFKRVVAVSPKDADAVFTVALLALQTNDLDEAEDYLRRSLELQPENDQVRLYLGQVAEQRKQHEEAVHWYGQIESGDLHFEAQGRMAIALARTGNVEKARNHLHSLNPKNEAQRVQIVLSEEQILRDAKQFNEAFGVLSRALITLPDNVDLLYARSLVSERLGKIDTAEKDLRRVLKKDPKNANALNALGYTLADRTNRYDEALGFIQQALALKPDDPFILDSLGWVHFRLGNHAEAVKYLRAALEKRADAEIAAHLGEVLWVMGDQAGAESVWKGALKQSPDSEALIGVINKFQPK